MDCGGSHRVSAGSDDGELRGVNDWRPVRASPADVLVLCLSGRPATVGISRAGGGARPVPRRCRRRVDKDRGTKVGPVFAVVHGGGGFTVNSAVAAQHASWVFHRRGLSSCWWLVSPVQTYDFVVVEDRLHVLWFAQGEVVAATHPTACRLVVDLGREPLTVIRSVWPCGSCLLDWRRRYG